MKSNEKLWRILVETISNETGLAGVPLEVVMKRVKELSEAAEIDADEEHIQALIQKGLDEWVFDKTIDELSYQKMKEFGLPEESGFIWHLKVLAPEKAEFYKSLSPEAKALIRLLREQNDPITMGTMQKEVAIQRLNEQGFSDNLRYIHAEDTIEEFIGGRENNSSIWYYGLVKEYEKTEEFKKWQEEATNRAIETQEMRHRRNEEFEIIDPIYCHLDELANKREEDLEELGLQRQSMSEHEYLMKKAIIEKRDEGEEMKWRDVIDVVETLNYDDLIALQKLFLRKSIPSLDDVFSFLDEIERKGS
ncbi:MAG: hypothetical protein ACFFER_10425 [Candidatus Thorarchaeota archaeon]